jgi:hypothetical protein
MTTIDMSMRLLNAETSRKQCTRRRRRHGLLMAWVVIGVLPPTVFAGGSSLPSPTESYLMTLAFPEWKEPMLPAEQDQQPPSVIRRLHLPPTEAAKLVMTPSEENFRSNAFTVVISPLFASLLGHSRALLVTSGYVRELSTRTSGASLWVIGVFFFSRTEETWKLSTSIPIATLASGSPRKVKVRIWAGHGRVLSFLINRNYQGANTDEVYLLGLRANRATPLLHTIIEGDNEGEGVDTSQSDVTCDQILDPKFVPPKGVSFLPQFECTRLRGSWAFEGSSVEFHFNEAVRTISATGRILPLKTYHPSAVLQLQKDGRLKLVAGKLPTYNF